MLFNGGGGSGVSGGGSVWGCLAATARRGNGEAKMAGTTRGREGGARRGNATTSWCDKRTRGWHNKRTTRHDAIISWHDKTMRGWRDEMRRRRGVERQHNNQLAWEGGWECGATRGQIEAMQQQAGATRGWEGDAMRGRWEAKRHQLQTCHHSWLLWTNAPQGRASTSSSWWRNPIFCESGQGRLPQGGTRSHLEIMAITGAQAEPEGRWWG